MFQRSWMVFRLFKKKAKFAVLFFELKKILVKL